jgi:hypothetical protein
LIYLINLENSIYRYIHVLLLFLFKWFMQIHCAKSLSLVTQLYSKYIFGNVEIDPV